MSQNEQIQLFDNNPEYQKFVDKFKPKKTTDDCYTPPEIYEIVKNWACKEYGIDPSKIVRPFYPGGDYERYNYLEGAVVLDNPPFSILSKICAFYLNHNIPFFLFAPAFTVFSGTDEFNKMNHICVSADITYENGAVVRTSFVTSFGNGIVAQTAPELGRLINEASDRLRKKRAKKVSKYIYPDHIITAAGLARLSKYGVNFKIHKNECIKIRKLDCQQSSDKAIYGAGLLLSNKAAAEKIAAEKKAERNKRNAEIAAVKVWELSERERKIIDIMSRKGITLDV